MSEAAATPEPPPQPLVADRLADFSDKLSPMLVKELRQGLRAKTFVIVFLTLQGLLLLVLLSAVAASAQPQRAGGAISGIIFMFYSVAVLIIQPIRGIGALHREVHAKTIELMVLTRLSAWKIVLGKWISIVSQSGLILAAIIPYLILRYWFGDMNLFGELSLMLLVFVASAVITAIIVGISCVPSVLLRGLLPLLTAAVGLFVIPRLCFGEPFETFVDVASMNTSEHFWGVAIGGLCVLYLGWTALGIGAGMIAPAAENHSTLKRIITLGLLVLLLPVAAFAPVLSAPFTLLLLIILIPSLALALTEPFTLMPPVCTPFVKRGAPGILAGRLLYPGWPSGVFFSVAALALATASFFLVHDRKPDLQNSLISLGLLGSVLMPATLTVLFDKKIANRFTTFLLIFAATAIVAFVVAYIAAALDVGERGFLWFFAWMPSAFFSMNVFDRDFIPGNLVVAAAIAASAYLLALIIIACTKLREISSIERETDSPAP